MCTVVVLVRPTHVLLAANRDERLDRAWDPPGAWWPDHPRTIAGRDRTAGGTWMGMNRHGVVAAVLNRPGTLGPTAGKRSRGELPLIALDHPTAAAAAQAIAAPGCRRLARLQHGARRPHRGVLRARPRPWPCRRSRTLPQGVSMVTAYDPNDLESPRTARHLPRFQAAEPSGPDDWRAGATSWPTGAAIRRSRSTSPRGAASAPSARLLSRFPPLASPYGCSPPGPIRSLQAGFPATRSFVPTGDTRVVLPIPTAPPLRLRLPRPAPPPTAQMR